MRSISVPGSPAAVTETMLPFCSPLEDGEVEVHVLGAVVGQARLGVDHERVVGAVGDHAVSMAAPPSGQQPAIGTGRPA